MACEPQHLSEVISKVFKAVGSKTVTCKAKTCKLLPETVRVAKAIILDKRSTNVTNVFYSRIECIR